MSSKTIISICAGIGMTLGGFVPWVFDDHEMIDGWSILGGMVGGFVGIWLGVKLSKQLR